MKLCETAAVLRHHHPLTLTERIDQLMAAVFIADERERISRLAEHLAPDFVYVNPSAVVEGAEGLSDAYSGFRHDAWRHISLRRTSEVDVHHAHFRFTWESLEGTKVIMRGWCFGWVDAEGKIARLVSFNDRIPGAHL